MRLCSRCHRELPEPGYDSIIYVTDRVMNEDVPVCMGCRKMMGKPKIVRIEKP